MVENLLPKILLTCSPKYWWATQNIVGQNIDGRNIVAQNIGGRNIFTQNIGG